MADSPVASDREYLTFEVGAEEFGVDILSVQELKVWSTVTEIPNTPDYLKGVINLRGVIVPIVDLRQRFNHCSAEYSATTVVIVLQGEVKGKKSVVGIVVDAVSDVHKVTVSEIKEAPDLGSEFGNRFVSGMATIGDKIIILLDTVRLLDVDELFQQAKQPSLIA